MTAFVATAALPFFPITLTRNHILDHWPHTKAAMVHVRLNEREPNPNPHVNFITPLPSADPAVQEDARQLLRALAAQVRPVMKAHGFAVNSLEEYEHNRVFAGRNWNNGEVVELVLRGLSGAFMPLSWLMSTFCHEVRSCVRPTRLISSDDVMCATTSWPISST